MTNKNYEPFSPNTNLSKYDYIIIGSGVGGLTVATWLAKSGKKVVVLERHYAPGGFTHTFKRKQGFKWDVGVHYVGNLNKKGPLLNIFNYLTNLMRARTHSMRARTSCSVAPDIGLGPCLGHLAWDTLPRPPPKAF